MLNILERYIGGALVLYTIIVLLVLVSIYFFTTLVGEMSYVGRGQYTFLGAVSYSALNIPHQIHELFPMAALVGTMLGLGSLANSSELTVMRASGMSLRHIVLVIAKVGVLMVAVVALNSEFVAPAMEKHAHFQRMEAIERSISFRTGSGLWVRDGNDILTMQTLMPNGDARQITRYQMDGPRIVLIAEAQSGRFEQDSWSVENVVYTRFEADGVHLSTQEHETWQTKFTPEMVGLAALSAEKLSIGELYDFIRYLRGNNLASERYEMAMWMRLLLPLATGGMILLALPFVFGSMRSKGIEQRIMIGVLLGIGFYLVNGIVTQLGLVYRIPPFLGAAVPTLMIYLLAVMMLRRVH